MFNSLFFLFVLVATSPSALAQRVIAGQVPPRISPTPVASECPADSSSGWPSLSSRPDDFVLLERTRCFGSCPAYSVRIGSDGKVTWRGEAYVQVIGPETAWVDPAGARALIEKFAANGFGNLCGRYSVGTSDGATVTTTVHIADQEKRVSDYFNSAPGWLRSLENEVDTLADTHRWIHGDPRTETFAKVRVPWRSPNFLNLTADGLGADAIGPKPGRTPLMQASAKGDVSEIQKQLSSNVEVNAQDSSGWTALMYAARTNQPEAMKLLLDADANPNVRSYMGQTALMAVANTYTPPLEKLRMLIAARADVNAQDNEGHTTLMFAMYGALIYDRDTDRGFLERAELVSTLREAGARTNLRDDAGHTVFDYLDEEAKIFWRQKSEPEQLRLILQNPAPGAHQPVRVKGRITSGSNPWVSGVELRRVGSSPATVRAAVAADESFEIASVPPGPYRVNLMPALSFPLPPLTIVVPNTDVTNLEIPVPSVTEVTVRVATEGNLPSPNFGLVFAPVPKAGSGPVPVTQVPANLATVIPPNIQSALAGGVTDLRLIRLGDSPLVDDATFRIALPGEWSFQDVWLSNRLPGSSFKMTLPEGAYNVGAILPRLRGGLPRIYSVKSLGSGSRNLLSESLKISGGESAEIQAVFTTTSPAPWVKLSGRVLGLQAGAERDSRVVLSGEVVGTLEAPVQADGSFEFPQVLKGRYIARIASTPDVIAATQRPKSPSDQVITVEDKDVTGVQIVVR
jgi:hypothetical protein